MLLVEVSRKQTAGVHTGLLVQCQSGCVHVCKQRHVNKLLWKGLHSDEYLNLLFPLPSSSSPLIPDVMLPLTVLKCRSSQTHTQHAHLKYSKCGVYAQSYNTLTLYCNTLGTPFTSSHPHPHSSLSFPTLPLKAKISISVAYGSSRHVSLYQDLGVQPELTFIHSKKAGKYQVRSVVLWMVHVGEVGDMEMWRVQ